MTKETKNNFRLTERTEKIIANFSAMNKSLLFHPGSELRTLSEQRDVMAIAKVAEEFPIQFGIFELHKFLSILSTYDDPVIEFDAKQLTITDADKSHKVYKYSYADPAMILTPPDEDLELEGEIANFTLAESDLSGLIKIVSLSKHPEIAIVAKDGDLLVQAIDSSNLNKDTFTCVIGKSDNTFSVKFKEEKFSVLLPSDYNVVLTPNACLFESSDVKYFIAPEDSE